MARTATLKVSISTDTRTAHIGRFFADLRIGGKQATKVGTVSDIRDYISKRRAEAEKHGVILVVTDETYKKEFTASGGMN